MKYSELPCHQCPGCGNVGSKCTNLREVGKWEHFVNNQLGDSISHSGTTLPVTELREKVEQCLQTATKGVSVT